MEIYHQIKDHPHYSVSNLGNVRSNRTNRVLKQDCIKGKYLRVALSSGGVVTRIFTHRLVADAFIPNPLGKPYVNHIDNDPSNNNASNLEWVTHSENMLHCTKQGRGTHSMAADASVDSRRDAITKHLQAKLGSDFISYNPVPGGKGSITYLCFTCRNQITSRTDSATFKREQHNCHKCSYNTRKSK